jgi:ribonuclease J
VEGIGLPLDEDNAAFVAETEADVVKALGALKGATAREPGVIAEAARLAARRSATRWSGKRPQVRVIMPGEAA